jgi:MFS family permease
MAIFLWIYAFMSPVAGIIADRLNRKWLIIGSLFIWSAVTLTMGYAQTFHQLYVLRAVMGISEAFYMPAAMALMADYHTGKTRSRAMSIHVSGIYIGQALGGFGASIAAVSSWQMTFQFFGIIGIVYSFILMFVLYEKRGDETEPQQKTASKTEFSGVIKGLGILFNNIAFWIILFQFAAPSFSGWAAKSWLPTLFSHTLDMDMAQAGPMATITISMASLIGVLLGGVISDKWVQRNLKGRVYLSTIGFGLMIPALFLLGFGTNIVSITCGAICYGLGFGIWDVNNVPILCQFVSPRQRATCYGLMNFAGISIGGFTTAFLGKSMDAGHLGRDFVMLSIPVAIAIVLLFVFLKPKTINKTEI